MIDDLLKKFGYSKKQKQPTPSLRNNSKTQYLSQYDNRQSKRPASMKYQSKRKTVSGIPLEELEFAYYTDGITFNTINIMANTMFMTGYDIQTKNEETAEVIKNWLRSIDFDRTFYTAIKYSLIFGTSYMERIKNTITNKTIKYENLDPKTITVDWNDEGEITGFKQTQRGTANTIELNRHKIIMMKFFDIPDSIYGFSIIEPVYSAIVSKRMTEEGITNAIWRHGFPMWQATVGTEDQPASEEEFQKWQSYLTNINSSNEFITNPFVKIEELNTGKDIKANDYLNYFIRLETGAYGVPEELLGSTMGSTYATSYTKLESFERNIKSYQITLKQIMLEQIIKPYMAEQGIQDETVDIVFNEFNPEDKNNLSSRTINEYNSGIITLTEAREELGFSEELEGELKPIPTFDSSPYPTSDTPNTPPSYFSKQEIGEECSNEVVKTFNELMNTNEYEDVKQYIGVISKQTTELNKQINNVLLEYINKSYIEGRKNANKRFGLELALTSEDDAAIEWLRQHAMFDFKGASKEINKKINTIIQQSLEEGWSVPKTYRAILKVFDVGRARASTIARTEISRAQNMGALQTYKEAGVEEVQWLTEIDDRTSNLCKSLNGKKTSAGDNFKTTYTNESGKIETWAGKIPPSHPNCRCTIIPIVKLSKKNSAFPEDETKEWFMTHCMNCKFDGVCGLKLSERMRMAKMGLNCPKFEFKEVTK